MTLAFSPHFVRSYRKAPAVVQRAFDKQSAFLCENLHHPSLHAKKYGVADDVWQARVNDSWRFYFTIEGDAYHLVWTENSSYRFLLGRFLIARCPRTKTGRCWQDYESAPESFISNSAR